MPCAIKEDITEREEKGMKRLRKLLAGMLAMVMALSCMPGYGLEVKAASGDFEYVVGIIDESGWFRKDANGDCVEITKYTGSGSEVVIPSEIDGKKAVSIGEAAFSGASGLTSVTIPDSVKYINWWAFKDCSSLASVKFPNSLTVIGLEAFNGCTSLKDITIPASVTRMGESSQGTGVFDNSILESIKVEEGNQTFDSRDNCNAIIVTESNVLSVGCKNTTIPNSVTKIGNGAFYNCKGLESIKIPSSVTNIGSMAVGWFLSEETGQPASNPNFIVYGMSGSAAETYAKENGLKFQAASDDDLYWAAVTLENDSYTYDGTAKTPSVTVKMGEKTLVLDTDYTVSYSDNTNAGTATVTVTGKGNYTGSKQETFTIQGMDISKADIKLGGSIFITSTPVLRVMLNGKTLELDKDYTFTHNGNRDTGIMKVVVTGIGNYAGTAEAEFSGTNTIPFSPQTFSITLEQTSYIYDGKPKTPSVTVKMGEKVLDPSDYTVTYSDNINVGTATVTVTGRLPYSGIQRVTFTISEAAKADISKSRVILLKTKYIYDGTAKTPSVTVKMDGKVLVLNTDYTVAYSNNTNIGTATVTVTGKGNYTGSKTATFTIAKAGGEPDSKITCKKTVYKVAYGTKPFKINATSKSTMTFTSSKPKIAAVDKNTGKVTIKNTGVAAITIKAGTATKKVTIKVSPKKQAIKSVKAVKGKKLTVKWAKDKMASGYQVQISMDKKFKKNVKSKNLSKTSYTFGKLNTGKKYYARVRSYKKSGKETLYGAWSKVKLSSKVKK